MNNILKITFVTLSLTLCTNFSNAKTNDDERFFENDAGGCLNVERLGIENGTVFNLYACTYHKSQSLLIDGQTIKPYSFDDRCMNLHENKITNGAIINLWFCNGSVSQNWVYEDMQIKLKANKKYCVNLERADAKAGIINLWECNGTKGQKWWYQGNPHKITS